MLMEVYQYHYISLGCVIKLDVYYPYPFYLLSRDFINLEDIP
jgi:hypothetical protein